MPISDNTAKIFDKACSLIAEGKSLREIAKLDGMKSPAWMMWAINQDETGQLAEHYTRAKEAQSEGMVDQMIEIARTEEDVQRARLLIDTIKWTASKLKAKVYGDKLQAEVSGTLTMVVQRELPDASK